ncbi:MAG TPA: MFS transporter [Gaiellaceae bacterium]
MRRRLPPALRHRDFAFLWVALLADGFGAQMIAVAVGWQVYEIHRNPLDLGLIGLMEFLPLPLLALPAGQLADRLSRRFVYACALALDSVVAGLLVWVSLAGATQLWPFLALAGGAGIASALGWPAARSLPPVLVPPDLLGGALALRGIAVQTSVIIGPAIGGVLFAFRPELVYAVAAGLFVAALICTLGLREGAATEIALEDPAPGLDTLLGGVRFVKHTPVVLGAILLDLFAVLFGGAVALLPLFARDVLHVGPEGLGVLRSAPAAGALIAGILLARRPIGGHAGRTLLVVVGVFGASMVVFGLSTTFWLSILALAVSGFADMFSMNIRSTTVALATPNDLRGRVNAVEMVFISASNELGAFESGVAAALIGAVPAVVVGGILTVGIAVGWAWLFPPLARVDRLEQLRPATEQT